MTGAELRRLFSAEFGSVPRLFSAPGRVNLIGEHTDYNAGFVLPMAIEQRTVVAGAGVDSALLRVRSLAHDERVELDLTAPGPKQRGRWFDYVEGTAQALLERGIALRGADLLVWSDVPIGSGLSSSAALEMSVGYTLCGVSGVDPDLVGLALAGQSAEHEYVGTRCGIMDQYIVALAREGHALLIDCRSLVTEAIPLSLQDAVILVCDSGVHHELASSAYNERRRQCEEAAALLAAPSLRDVSLATLERQAGRLTPVLLARARHVVTENARTLAAAQAFRAGDLRAAGQLMLESHRSLRDDYAVSCPELDALVDMAAAAPGVYGARMTGGGFGGSAIVLLERGSLPAVRRALEAGYSERFGARLQCFVSGPCAGVREDAA